MEERELQRTNVAPSGHLMADSSSTGEPAASVSNDRYLDIAVERTSERLPEIDAQAMALSIALTNIASAHVRRSEVEVHSGRGRTWVGFRLLYMIWMFEPVEAKDLSRLAEISRQTTNSGLNALEKQGLITRERPSGGDRRLVSLRLTQQGRREAEESVRSQNHTMRKLFSALDLSEQETLLKLLRKLQRAQWSQEK